MNRFIIRDLRIRQKFYLGFTLVELLVVMAILVIMIAILIGTLNPIALVNKAKDSRRKNDLKEIKVAFENYYADKGEYPPESEVEVWNVVENCNKPIPQMASYLKTLPCDPYKKPYIIEIIDEDTFKVITNLDNKKDIHIPPNWYAEGTYLPFVDRKTLVNYGVSSSNILWYEGDALSPVCIGLDCLMSVDGGPCTRVRDAVCITGGNVQCRKGNDSEECNVALCCDGLGCD